MPERQSPSDFPKGRGSGSNPPNRFDRWHIEPDPEAPEEDRSAPQTVFLRDASESILVKNESPDVPFEWGLNPYRGCEHGCPYCYARPTHEYLGFSSGLDFESRIVIKERAPELLRRELSAPRWIPTMIGMSGVTDCYQPVERRLRLTRACIEVMRDFRQPVSIITKNALVTRDADLLSEMAQLGLCRVTLSLTTLRDDLSGSMEPRASRPRARLEAIRRLSAAGVTVGVNVAPVIPGLNEAEIPAILSAAAEAGATYAGWEMLRLPWAVKEIFFDWLRHDFPGHAQRVEDRVRSVRGGQLHDAEFGRRMRGEGFWAGEIARLFQWAARRNNLHQPVLPLRTDLFRNGSSHQAEFDFK